MRAILILAVMFLFAACNNNGSEEYSLTLQETLNKVSSKEDVLSAAQVADILLSNDENILVNYQFVDARTPYEYNVWHAPGAVNIPSKDVFSEEYEEILNNNKIKVLYCKGSHQSMNVYTQLIQKGYKNIKVSLGGYSFLRYHIIDSLNLSTGIYNEDSALYDYVKVVKETAGASSVTGSTQKATTTKKVVRRKKKEVEGGCG